jgi:hypothetical protein
MTIQRQKKLPFNKFYQTKPINFALAAENDFLLFVGGVPLKLKKKHGHGQSTIEDRMSLVLTPRRFRWKYL